MAWSRRTPFDVVAAADTYSLASRIIYAAVGLSAVYLLGRIRALVGASERVPSAA